MFVELPAFERHRDDYFDDDGFSQLQVALMANPVAGDLIEGTGGLRKVRFGDSRRSKGKRGGLRVIYYYWTAGPEFWLFTLYDKDEMADLTPKQRAAVKRARKRRVEDEEKVMTKKRDLFKELSEGFDALADQRAGKRTLRTHAVKAKPVPKLTARELARIREGLNLSRALFAGYLRTNVRTLENWEQGRAKPNAQAALLIRMVQRFPDTVHRLADI